MKKFENKNITLFFSLCPGSGPEGLSEFKSIDLLLFSLKLSEKQVL